MTTSPKNRENKEQLRKRLLYMLLAMVLTCLATSVIFVLAHRFPGCEYTFLFGDQEVQFALVDRMFWRHFLLGEGLDFSFSYSMGLPTSALYAVLQMSPFGVIHVLIGNAEWAAVIIYLLKMMAAAGAFWWFSVIILRADEKKAVLFAVIYALSSYSLHFYMNIHFLDVVYIMPLLMLALVHFADTGRRGWLILIYTFGFLNIFLTGYSLGIFSFVVFIAILILKGMKGRELAGKLLAYLLSVIAAVLVSMIVILPAALFFMEHMPGGSTFSETERMLPWEFFISFLPARKALVFNTLPALYCGLPVLLLVLLYFLDSGNPKRERIAASVPLVFLLICTFWHPAYLMLHGFDEPDSFAFRFSYLWVFYLLSIAVTEFTRTVKKMPKKKAYAAYGFIVGAYSLLFFALIFTRMPSERPTLMQWAVSLLLMSAYALLLAKGKEEAGWTFAGIWLAEVVISGAVSLQNLKMDTDTLRSSVEERALSTGYLREIYEEISEKEQDLFFRVELPTSYSSNEMMELDIHGTGYFSSIENSNLRNELYSLGYQGRPQFVTGRGGTDFTRMIFDNKYTVEKTWGIEGRRQFAVTEHEQTLPLAFMVSDRILEYAANGDNPFENQNRLACAMTGKETEVFSKQAFGGNIVGVTLYPEEDITYIMMNEDSGGIGAVEFYALPETDGEAYLYLSQDTTHPEEYKGASIMPDEVGSDWAGVGYSLYVPGIVPMAETADGSRVATLILQRDPGSVVSFLHAYCAMTNPENLSEVYKSLLPGALKMTSFTETRIEGTVLVSEDLPVLYTSIPYDRGWHISVDGIETDTFAVMDGAFLAAKLTPGEHSVVMYYDDRRAYIGSGMALAGLVLFMILLWLDVRKKKKA